MMLNISQGSKIQPTIPMKTVSKMFLNAPMWTILIISTRSVVVRELKFVVVFCSFLLKLSRLKCLWLSFLFVDVQCRWWPTFCSRSPSTYRPQFSRYLHENKILKRKFDMSETPYQERHIQEKGSSTIASGHKLFIL